MHLKQSPLVDCLPAHAEERRRNPRREVQGVILLDILKSDLRSSPIRASLIDLSASGFRASHASKELCSDQEVTFFHDEGEGRARVVWTRIVGQSVESGFLICQEKRQE
ncbi:MAG: hypothetical protein AUH13_18555 [Acidobacteria bacterium 13_2_20CM_58_27]|nr:MAG: hypothetical protein AUH13_18555 [Acidobacteria bacterium 13_2_20CM_58_27]